MIRTFSYSDVYILMSLTLLKTDPLQMISVCYGILQRKSLILTFIYALEGKLELREYQLTVLVI